MRPGRFYAAVLLLTLATLVLEIVQTRLLSVVSWYHLAFFVISVAMFGMTAGAVWVYLNKERFRPEALGRDLSRFSAAFAATTGLSLFVQVTLAPSLVFSASTVLVFLILSLTIATPFFFSGVAVSLALTRSPFPIGRVYAADLAGASLGCLSVLALLELTDGPSAILWAGAVAALAALLFRSAGAVEGPPGPGRDGPLARPGLILAVLAVLALANGATRHGIQPMVVKDVLEKRTGKLLFEKWNHFSRVVALRDTEEPSYPSFWGPSPVAPKDLAVEQIGLTIDGGAATPMYRWRGGISELDFLIYDVTNLAYVLRNAGRAAVIGVGGGRDLQAAWHFGFRDVTGVEINPIFIDLLTRRAPFKDFAGFAHAPGVRFVVDDARSWFTRTQERFDLVQMSMVDTWAATSAGAFTLSENGLYTLEGWKTFIGRLTPEGVFTVSRWHRVGAKAETGRMMSLAVASLLDLGVPDPSQHLFLASSGNISTLVLSREPLVARDLETLHRAARERLYEVVISPGETSPDDVLGRIVKSSSRAELDRAISGMVLDLSPPTDNRPFFFNLLRFRNPLAVAQTFGHRGPLAGMSGVVRGNLVATTTLVVILLVALVLVAFTIVLPLRPGLRDVGRDLVVSGTLFFTLLGLGFMLVEMGLLQRLSLFLGHPVYSLSIVLFSLILATGAGSFLSERLPLRSKARFVSWGLLLGAYLLFLSFRLPGILASWQGAGTLARAALSVLFIAPAGILMGFGFPTGMRLVQAIDSRPTPWFWGINGAAGVLASVLAVISSIAFGIQVTLAAGALCYLAMIPTALSSTFRWTPALADPNGPGSASA
jgi:hypothetical protein